MKASENEYRSIKRVSCIIIIFCVCLLLLPILHVIFVCRASDHVCSGDLKALKVIVYIDPLVVNARTDIDNLDDYSLLYSAVGSSNKSMVRFLIRKGANLNWHDWLGETPLFHAIDLNDEAIAKILLKAGADPNLSSANTTPLSRAIENKNPRLIALLKSYGAHM